jgi:ABC-type phosphate/phosphonate transport system ATPase subunit
MDSETERLRNICPRFRALVIGRPNAGKTTILRCIAQAADGRVSAVSTLTPTELNSSRLTLLRVYESPCLD